VDWEVPVQTRPCHSVGDHQRTGINTTIGNADVKKPVLVKKIDAEFKWEPDHFVTARETSRLTNLMGQWVAI
jgi:hypothetical protein